MTRHSTYVYMTATLFLLLTAAGVLGPMYAQLQQSGGPGGTVTANQGGTWNLTNISGTVSLPTGAATAAKQPALGTAGPAPADAVPGQGAASLTPPQVGGAGGRVPLARPLAPTGLKLAGAPPAPPQLHRPVQ